MNDEISQNGARSDIRPLVASAKSDFGIWVFGGALLIAGIMLFETLESRRAGLAAPSISRSGSEGNQISAAPELEIPESPQSKDWGDRYARFLAPRLTLPESRPSSTPRPSFSSSGSVSRDRQAPSARDVPVGLGSLPDYPRPSPATLSGNVPPSVRPQALSANLADEQEKGKERVVATHFANPATTVPKGTVMQAVLETALDSSRPGFARAVISRDVTGFDGTVVLVPRGSRLIGEYKSDLGAGQRRALIQWQRLMRPDGVVINLDSPSADPLGRAGIGGKVNTHFFERFAGSILQSTLDIGVQLATRRISRDTYILALPGSTQGLIANGAEKIPPTVTVRQGASVSVFVARDLDFTLANQ